jgi:hypothetical protein
MVACRGELFETWLRVLSMDPNRYNAKQKNAVKLVSVGALTSMSNIQ